MIKIKLNGEKRQFEEELSIAELLEDLELNPQKIAVEKNLEIVPKSTYRETSITDGDAIEIVAFIGGG